MNSKKSGRIWWLWAILMYAAFGVLLFELKTRDIRPIGPEGSSVGLAGFNEMMHEMIGVNPEWYEITDYMGYAAIALAGAFALLGLFQLISRRSFAKVDRDIYMLAILYAACIGCYLLFEKVIINYRPVILDEAEGLEASFPSSHTMIAIVILGSAIHQLRQRIRNGGLRVIVLAACWLLMIGIIAGRIMSGVHWATDIAGGLLLALALIFTYKALCRNTVGAAADDGYRPKH